MPARARIRQLSILSACLLSHLVGAHTVSQSVAASSSNVLDRLHSLLFKPARPSEPEQERIPKILHHIFLSGEKELRKAASGPDPPMRIEWSENCVHQHDGWQVMFWDMEASLQLLRQEYPWFLETFQSYKRRVQQGDAIRYFILNTHGGVYMDMDVECFRPTDSFLRGYDLVLNVELGEGVTVTNAVMASAPNITFWQRVFTKMQERKAWEDGFLEKEVVSTTGPWMLTDTLKEHLHIRARSAGEYIRPTGEVILQGRSQPPLHLNEVIKVYEVGAWFTPCIFDNEQCHVDLVQAKQNGTIDLSRLAGYHRYQGTWKPCMGECFKDIEHRTKGDQNPLQGNVGDSLVQVRLRDGRFEANHIAFERCHALFWIRTKS
ncbi:hypothetical protein WJX84_011944 [Apatococcus fuscideae]|uniref:Uncharacterized protein n=1 Tax=Apatococcus fuscideae TaxID=2026836 RepID=A0AAW1SXI0_9CHLO